ncbi:hypothetical protein HY407_01480 [Candidatus Gottesmanbacteria bacterium]|nr:hypothetical protein [Candidatus Gottesmanbacteria bacterium]
MPRSKGSPYRRRTSTKPTIKIDGKTFSIDSLWLIIDDGKIYSSSDGRVVVEKPDSKQKEILRDLGREITMDELRQIMIPEDDVRLVTTDDD